MSVAVLNVCCASCSIIFTFGSWLPFPLVPKRGLVSHVLFGAHQPTSTQPLVIYSLGELPVNIRLKHINEKCNCRPRDSATCIISILYPRVYELCVMNKLGLVCQPSLNLDIGRRAKNGTTIPRSSVGGAPRCIL